VKRSQRRLRAPIESSDTPTKSEPDPRSKPTRKSARSPSALVRELLDVGYFDSLRTLAEVQRRLRDKTGHQIPVTTLSSTFTRLLRSGLVDRERTDDGVYAYQRSKSSTL
jgi:hypothetical protein